MREEEIVGTTPEGLEIRVTPDGERFIVEPGKLVSGRPPKDGIPSIDRPKYVSVEEADAWIRDDELEAGRTRKPWSSGPKSTGLSGPAGK